MSPEGLHTILMDHEQLNSLLRPVLWQRYPPWATITYYIGQVYGTRYPVITKRNYLSYGGHNAFSFCMVQYFYHSPWSPWPPLPPPLLSMTDKWYHFFFSSYVFMVNESNETTEILAHTIWQIRKNQRWPLTKNILWRDQNVYVWKTKFHIKTLQANW